MNYRNKTLIYCISSVLITLMIIKYSPYKIIKNRHIAQLEHQNDSLYHIISMLKDSLILYQTNVLREVNIHTVNNKTDNTQSEKIATLESEILSKAYTYNQLKIVIDNISIKSPNFKFIPSLFPLKPNSYHKISSAFGNRFHPIKKSFKFHEGLDIATQRGNTVHAPADGVVTGREKNGGYGNVLIIQHKFGFKSVFAHLDGFYVKKGEYVKYGQAIGAVGNSGLSTGPHLHYEIIKNGYKINPIDFAYLTHKKLSSNF